MSDQEDFELPQPKSRRGKKLYEKNKPQLEEGPKQTLFLRGPKTSNDVRELFKELYLLKKDNSTMFARKHEVKPFEEAAGIEEYCKKNNCGQFCVVSHSKKRPNNLVIGRIFNEKILDMIEFGVENYKSPIEFGMDLKIPIHSRPLIIFNGEGFGFDNNLIRAHNLFTDFFNENISIPNFHDPNLISLIISISAFEDKLQLSVFQRQVINDMMQVDEIGPSCQLSIRRAQFADEDLFKKACKQPKPKKKSHEKNIKHDSIGNKKGRVFVQQNDLSTLAILRRKKLKKRSATQDQKDQKPEQLNEQQ